MIAAYQKRCQTRVDTALETLFQAPRTELERLYQAMRYSVMNGGKRVRPTLVLLAAQLGDPTRQQVIDASVVVELTHLATLYHDDVMDEAPLRRGVPSAHEVWGNSVAILTGDLLFSRASTLMTRLGEKAMLLQAETFERLCLGQLHETIGPRPDEDPVSHYIQVLADKTGSLISAAARCGIVYSGAPLEYEDAMVEFGDKIGVAFQLANFIRDVGEDLERGRVYLPLQELAEHGVTRQMLEARQLTPEIVSALKFQIARVRQLQNAAEPGIALLDKTSQPCIRAASELYCGIVDEVEKIGYDIFNKRAKTSTARRARVAFAAYISAVAARLR